MNACEELLVACDLHEVLGGKSAPDLVERTLHRLREPKAAPVKEETAVHALPPWPWQRFVLAASVVLALGLIGWLAWPRALPEGVNATSGANYSVKAEFIELREGALLLQTGAPEVRAGQSRVSGVNGRSLVRAGGVLENFAALEELPLNEKEKSMTKDLKRWVIGAGFALCVLSGSALLNDQLIEAKDEAPAPEKIESPKPEDIKGLQAMLESTTSVTVRGLDKNYRWCCPVEITNPIEVKELVDAIYSDLELSDKPAGWSSSNEITFTLRDGRQIEILVNIKSGLADLRLAGWERYYEYNVRADLLRRFQRPIDRSVANGPDCPAPAGLRKLRGFSGTDSRITKAERNVFDSNSDISKWEALWKRHRPGEAVPEVDFSHEMVVAIFQGNSVNSRGVELYEILERRDVANPEFTVRIDESSYQTEGFADSVTPYGIFVLETKGASPRIFLEENVQTMLNKPHFWKNVEYQSSVNRTEANLGTEDSTRLRGWEGEGSAVAKARHELVTTKAEFEKLWKEHKPGEAAPEVDFEKEQVVAIFQEVPKGWGGVKFREIYANSSHVVLRVRGTSYQTEGAPPELTMSFGIHVFAKDQKLTLELPSYSSMDAPPIWLETSWK